MKKTLLLILTIIFFLHLQVTDVKAAGDFFERIKIIQYLDETNPNNRNEKDYENFVKLLNDVSTPDVEKPNINLYPEILKRFYDFIELYPENQWTFAAFHMLAKNFYSFQFDLDATYDDIFKITNNFQFKSKYSKFIFYSVVITALRGNGYDNYPDEKLEKLYSECKDEKFIP